MWMAPNLHINMKIKNDSIQQRKVKYCAMWYQNLVTTPSLGYTLKIKIQTQRENFFSKFHSSCSLGEK